MRQGGRKKKRKADAIEPNEDHVIVAGFGRFGQIVGRFLHANGVRLTVLDHDPDQIEVLRRFGFKVFYGDATRADLLRAAGAAKARALVVAIDDIDDSLAGRAVRREYPDLPIFARARNVTHYYQLMDRGVDMIERETFEAALQLGRTVLTTGLGQNAYRIAPGHSLKFRKLRVAEHRERRRRSARWDSGLPVLQGPRGRRQRRAGCQYVSSWHKPAGARGAGGDDCGAPPG
jgi:glutathione-regulated potassium-efflux system ancillary protein KefC